ncbi:MAG: hypothetical protein PHC61_13915, partial [Chitinivibrionales bacterium]|nr:hypothetical protein [Chitinivibrionales bacterium]
MKNRIMPVLKSIFNPLFLFYSILLFTSGAVTAASITWGSATNISADADISTAGTAVYAYTWGSIQTVNTVTFAATTATSGDVGGNLTLDSFGSRDYKSNNHFGMGYGAFASLSTQYQEILWGAVFNSSTGTKTVTLKNLTSGNNYQVQVWVNNSYYDNSTMTVTAGNSVTLTKNVGGGAGVGQYAIGTFTADATTQVLSFYGNSGSSGVGPQLNAISLRNQSGPPPAPGVPVLSSPANAATSIAVNPTLAWNASSGATTYGLQVATDAGFTGLVVNQSGLTVLSYNVTGLTNSTTYYWRVNATNGGGTSAWSSVWSFTTSIEGWSQLTTPFDWDVTNAFAVSANNLFAGTQYAGVYRSTDNGANWAQVNTGLTNTAVMSLAMNGTNLFAGTQGGGVFLSTNNGASWASVSNGLPAYGSFRAFAISGATIFVGTYYQGIFLSTNNGASWSATTNGLPTGCAVY